MFRKSLAFLALAAIILVWGPAQGSAASKVKKKDNKFSGYIEITNQTGYDIYYLYISHESSDDWEEDVLGDDVLTDGESVKVEIEDYDTSIFDIRLEDEDGDTYTKWDVDIETTDLVITLEDLDESESTGDFEGYVDITNNTGEDIYYIYVSHESSDDWEEDVLGDDVLSNGESVRVNIEGYDTPVFDIRLESEDGNTYTKWDVDVEQYDLDISSSDVD